MIPNKCDCTSSNIIWLCKRLGLDYEFIFSNCLYFEYNRIYDEAGLNVKIISGSGNKYLLSDKYELELKKYDTTFFLYEALHNDEILMFEMDTYFCRWTKYYAKQHIGHRFIVTRFEKNYLTIYDPFFEVHNINIDICEVIEHVVGVFTFVLSPIKREKIEILKIFSNSLYCYKNRDVLKEGAFFCEDIYNKLMRNENVKMHIEENIILQDIRYISFNRYNYADTLLFLQSKYQLALELEEDVRKIEEIGNRWEKLNFMIIKSILKKNYKSIDYILQHLEKILRDEYKIVIDILYLLNQNL